MLRFPVSLPGLTSFEPYTQTENRLKALAGDVAPAMAFPHDWRRSIADAAAKLETAIDERLAQLKASGNGGGRMMAIWSPRRIHARSNP